ncbi:MAG: aminotransferase class I/II-fold pyridoxal phosphate-dependent enzyme, partial [Gammaproteobacteria bacterium]|nr:aminotransferase class I/II-fold pyridoxal phosphate-dependent enzyme [Gammaproteobacteria bacterium]
MTHRKNNYLYNDVYLESQLFSIDKENAGFELSRLVEQDEKGWHLDFSQIENAYRSGIKVHLLCNPHNPLGRLY